MEILLLILISTFFVSIISFIGALTLLFKESMLQRILFILISLSAGVLMGASFFDLMPESIAKLGAMRTFSYVLAGFVLFFLVEKVLQWRHCHDDKCHVHPFAYMNLFGDAVHNFIDGTIIAASFVSSTSLGIITTAAVALHEIPQEIGEFGVLIYGGFKRIKALMFNFISALMAILGGLIGYFLSSYSKYTVNLLLPIAAGGFFYIAASDLIPEIRKDTNMGKSFLSIIIFIAGILLIYFLGYFK